MQTKISKRNLARIAAGQPPEPSEADFQKQVLDLARLHGWRTAHFRPAMNGRGKWQTAVQGDGEGFPDTLFVRGAEIMVAELKVGANEVTDEQAAWLSALAEANVPAFVWRPDDWQGIVKVLKDGPGKFTIETEIDQ